MYNRVIIMGRLTADPELRQTQSGVSICRISVAVDRGYAKEGEEKKADFFNVVLWRSAAEFVSRYFGKGKMIHIEGKLQNNNYEDQNGVKHYNTDIIAENVSFCGGKSNNQQTMQSQYQSQYQQPVQTQQPQYQQPVQNGIELGDLSEFEEVLSDGEVPF